MLALVFFLARKMLTLCWSKILCNLIDRESKIHYDALGSVVLSHLQARYMF